MRTSYILLSLLTSLIINTSCYAGPVIKLCIEDNCKNPIKIKLTDPTWSNIKDLYKEALQTDKDEQDNIANSIALMETDIYSILATMNSNADTAETLYSSNSMKNNYRNLKSYLGVLMDQYLVSRHFMRKTLSHKTWTGSETYGLLLQSLANSQLYVLELKPANFGIPPAINLYTSDKKIFGISVNSKNKPEIEDEDIE